MGTLRRDETTRRPHSSDTEAFSYFYSTTTVCYELIVPAGHPRPYDYKATAASTTVTLLEPAAAPAQQARTLQAEIQRLKALQNPDLVGLINMLEARVAALTPDETALLPN